MTYSTNTNQQPVSTPNLPNQYIDKNFRPPEAALYTGISVSKLAKLRMQRFRHLGPKFIRVAGCIIYRKTDLDEWLNAHIVEFDALSSDG